ncbi:MAG: FtsB family cell division protein [Nocardioidaceae bacterium]
MRARASAGRTGTGRAGTGRAGTGRAGSRPGQPGRRPRTTVQTGRPPARPRVTGRAAVLVLVLAVLMVSYASSMRAYLQQRAQINGLRNDIAHARANIKALSREKARWKDPAYVRTQARQRFGWVPPGDVGLQVLDANGKPMGSSESTLSDPSVGTGPHRPEWYQSAWGSMVAAGLPAHAKKHTPTPATEIRAPKSGNKSH